MQIANALESYLTASNLRESSGKAKKFYLSDMGKCMRIRWLKRKGVESELDPYVYWIFEIGKMFHDFGYKALEAKGILLESEDEVETEHFKGRRDGIIKADEGKSIFDFKSVGAWKLNKYMGGNDDEENISQVLSYLLLEKQRRNDLSDTTYVSYLNKEPSEKAPIICFDKQYHLTSWREKKLEDEMSTLVDYWVSDKIPSCSCPAWMKPYNSFQPLCSAKENLIKRVLRYLQEGRRVITTKRTLYLVVDEHLREEVK